MNYPNGLKKSNIKDSSIVKTISHSNRGMTLESEINDSNQYYREEDIAIIYKKPTPIKITKVDYPSRDKATIKEAFFTVPSTTDYNGLYKGYYIDFEAKETKNKTSFSLDNIHPHQIKHLESINKHKGISFLIVRFTTLNETYLLETKEFLEFINNNNRKSIPINFFKEKGYIIKDGYRPRLDYLKIVDQILEVYKCEKKN
ncbi:MAG: Holliday junction resolvase RecU [Bacilli bacterium]|nr:Holliday junction resolvase RecU [Bacilli bacterium]